MSHGKINNVNAGQNLYNTQKSRKTPAGRMMKITDSFVSSNKDEPVELDLRKVSVLLTHKGGSSPVWTYKPDSKTGNPPVIAPDGNIYIGDGKKIISFDGKSGKVNKEFQIPGKVRNFVVTGKGYLVAADDDSVYGFDKKTGEITWKEQKLSDGKPLSDSTKSLTATPNDTVYVADYKYGVYAVNARTGNIRWENPTITYISKNPVLSSDGSTMFLTEPTGELHLVDTKSGDRIWNDDRIWKHRTHTLTGDVTYTSIPGGDFLFGYDDFYSAEAVDGKTGEDKWEYGNLEGLTAQPVADEKNDSIFLADKSGRIINLKTGGNVKWERDPKNGEKEVIKLAVGDDGTLFAGRKSDILQALDGKTGKLKRNFKIEGEKYLEPTIGKDNILHIKGESGKIYSFELDLADAMKKSKTTKPGETKTNNTPVIKQGETFVEIGGVKLPLKGIKK